MRPVPSPRLEEYRVELREPKRIFGQSFYLKTEVDKLLKEKDAEIKKLKAEHKAEVKKLKAEIRQLNRDIQYYETP